MSAPAGWYPDPQNPATQRWWDGTQWSMPAAPAPAAWVPPPAPVRADTNTVWVWLAVVASALPFAVVFLIDWNGYMDSMVRMQTEPGSAVAGIVQWQIHILGISLISWAAMGAYIVMAWLDWRELRRRGVPTPFSWAWSFFALLGAGAAVYMIGRAVVLKRRTESGGWPPLWAWIGVTVAGYILTFAWTFSMIGTMMTRMAGLYS